MTGRISIGVLLCVCCYTIHYSIADDIQDNACYKDENGISCHKTTYKLTRLESSFVGSIKEVVLTDGTELELKTLSLKPLIFELPNFLSEEECNHFRSLAHDIGLEPSQTLKEKTENTNFNILDLDGDRKLSVPEMRVTIEEAFDVYPHDEDILEMYAETGLDANNDGFITPNELNKLKPSDLQRYVRSFVQNQPEKHARLSNQVWLYPDNSTDSVFERIQKRVSEIVALPIELVKLSDFQVVQYGIDGHYNAHYDSTPVDSKYPCCVRFDKRNCRICRYMTILFYLNDVQEGGETAFPVADDEMFNATEVKLDKRNLFQKCDEAKLKVLPAKGKAVIWYNHFIDNTTQWLGQLDQYSIHGGCPVKKGKKWIGNFWIKVTDNKDEDIKRMEKFI
ncbi:transmembrane prolyl 4-hydroxylase-like [Gigantopelta aegis]|uniref:transmembrane prolyl 4-hydroxylase-like n=1 Tax=Gigantopelta aegis TaxID=1735272 RepID=UPI001B888ACF|nr:transmembrane prolyl 4-hydroxylase-like [Gigantopelta aegis]